MYLRNIILAIVLLFLIVACGGGGSSSSSTPSDNQVVSDEINSPSTEEIANDTLDDEVVVVPITTGVFIDAPVEGLYYETETLSGLTNSDGEFQYRSGETVSFMLGDIELGSVEGEVMITPLTLVGDTDINNPSIRAVNIARLLQTLDSDSANNAVITIPSTLETLFVSGADLDSDDGLDEILSEAQNLTSENYTLVDSVTAKEELQRQVQAYTNYELINQTHYTASGYQYYLLRLTEDSNVTFNHYGSFSFGVALQLGGTCGISLYDLDMTSVDFSCGDNAGQNSKMLTAGMYIVKVMHSSETQGSTFVVNSPDFINQESFEELGNGTYTVSGFEFFTLNMQSAGAIQFSYDNGLAGSSYPAYLYDSDLNFIDWLYDITELEAGKYVVLFYSGELTVQSVALN
jgi:hypothetical protein